MSAAKIPPLLEVRHATVQREETLALRRFSWTVRGGEHWAVLGPNGSGKSTLVQMLQGWLWPRTGTLSVLGRNFGSDDVAELRRHVAWVGQEAEAESPAHQSVGAIAASGTVGAWGLQFERPGGRQRARARAALRALGLLRLADRPFRHLSQGQRRLVVIARALAMRPRLLLLDEATGGLDPVARERFLRRVAGLLRPPHHPAVIYVTHHIEEILPGFTHVLLLRAGRCVAAGPRRDVLTPATLRATFGTRFTVAFREGRYWVRSLG